MRSNHSVVAGSLAIGLALVVSGATVVVGASTASARPHGRPAGSAPSAPPPAPGGAARNAAAKHHKPPAGPGRWFDVRCTFSHNGAQDPIVMPGMAGMSHNHEFFGNTTTDENSTAETLLAGDTTCNDANDTSAYWVPSLYQAGVRVEPREARVRYNVGRASAVVAFPAGFMAISGRSDSTAGWACLAHGKPPVFSDSIAVVPTCVGSSSLMARIVFPQCWDGTSLDSSDHASHLAWATKDVCPSDHPVRVPQITLDVIYPHTATGGADVTLASGSPSTLHADIFEAWQGTSLQQRITHALHGPAHRGGAPKPPPVKPGPHGPGVATPGAGRP